jgi:hypothetical protein
MSIFRIKIDFGPKGTTKSDEIFCDGFSISWPEILEEDLQNHQAEVEQYGRTTHFLMYNSDLCVHESATKCMSQFISASDLIRLNLDKREKLKLQPPFQSGEWYGIRPSHSVPMHSSAKVKYFTGSGVVNQVFREVKTYVLENALVKDLSLFWIDCHGSDCFVSNRFKEAYEQAKLTGLKFVDVNCMLV